MGQVCAKHNEYYENRCPWCEEPEACETAHPRLHASEKGGVCQRCHGDMFPTLKPIGLDALLPDPATYGGIMNLPTNYALSPASWLDNVRKVYGASDPKSRTEILELMERRIKEAEQRLLHDFNKRHYGTTESPNDGHGIFE